MSEEHQYISLSQASQYCDYSQEYLSLRARQKKLQAKKIGRNWFTTRTWLQEYISNAIEYKDNIVQTPRTNKTQLAKQTTRIPNFPPTNLPAPTSLLFTLKSQGAIDRYRYLMDLQRRIGLAFSLVVFIIVFIVNIVVWRAEISHLTQSMTRTTYSITKDFYEGFESANFIILSEASEIREKMNNEYLASVGSVSREYVTWIKTSIRLLGIEIVHLVKG